jgi:opacity protein-like surface antigen
MKGLVSIALAAGFIGAATPLHAQLFYVGLRGGAGVPAGAFGESATPSEESLLVGAKSGFGYGLDAGINLGPLGFYAGFDQMRFDCADESCPADDGTYKLKGVSGGIRLSVPLFPIVKPWVKAGVTFNELDVDFGAASSSTQFSTERSPGYELGVGVDIPFGGIFSLTPQVRYIGQKLDYRIPGVTTGDKQSNEANYYTFDLGLRLRSPL